MSDATCSVAGRCGGCPWFGQPDQRARRLEALSSRWREAGLPEAPLARVEVHGLGEHGLRDRVDLAWTGETLGLVALDGPVVVDVGPCPALSAPLLGFVQDLRADPPPASPLTLRCRVAPDGARGLWVDASNLNIKAILDEGVWLRRWLGAGVVVEMGQRRKPVHEQEGRMALLKEPVLRPWFQTWLAEDQASPLFLPVGGFSQPGHALNRLLVGRVRAAVEGVGAARWLEIGAGAGNFTLPLAASGAEVRAVEHEPIAVAGLKLGLAHAGLRAEVIQADMARAEAGAWLDRADAVLVDPPRSGLRGFAGALAQTRGALVYVSCEAGSLVADLSVLRAAGWEIRHVEGVDQFPQTPHGEWIVSLARS